MAGKILKISSNDLYGNVDDRRAVIFACFEHIKYMNNYAIFCFEDEYDKKKLYYGSIHLKNDSLVVFSVKNNIKQYIDEFISEYVADRMENFKILDISMLSKVELVSYNEMEYNDLQLLDDKSIIKVVPQVQKVERQKKPIFLYLLIFILILLCIGITLLYLYPEMFSIKYKELKCTNNDYDNNLMLYYDIDKTIKFDENDKLDSIDVVKVYTFLDSNSYYKFRDNNEHELYFNNGEGYKYIDEELRFKLIYEESNVIDDYEEMLTYMKKEGFSCIEKEYEK